MSFAKHDGATVGKMGRAGFMIGAALVSVSLGLGGAAVWLEPFLGAVALVLFWPAASLLLVATGYFGLGPLVSGKQTDGTRAAWAWMLHAPSLLLTNVLWRVGRILRPEDPYNEVAPGVFVGRRLRDLSELPPGVRLVVDLTAEYLEPPGIVGECEYVCVPTLDGTGLTHRSYGKALQKAAAFDGPVYVHCAVGHGRSAMFAASMLLRRGTVSSIDEAVALLRRSRPSVHVRPTHKKVIAAHSMVETAMMLESPMPKKREARWTWRWEDALKDTDVEEVIDWWWHRPLAFLLIKPLEHWGRWITPTHITVVAMLLGIACGICCFRSATDGAYWAAIGGVLMLFSVVFDCADGMLARLRGGRTQFGQMLDGFADYVAGFSFWFGMSYAITYEWEGWWVWPANALILVSVAFHAALYDQYKLYFVNHVDDRQIADQKTSEEPSGGLERVLQGLYDRLYGGTFLAIGGAGANGDSLDPETFRRTFARPMRWVSFLGLGTHLFLMYSLTILAAWRPDWTYWGAQIVVTGAMNALAFFAIWNWNRVDAALGAAPAANPSNS